MNNEYGLLLSQNQNELVNVTGNSYAIAAARIAYYLNLKGPAIPIDTACSSSLVAIHLACQALILHEIDMALAGGVTLYLTAESYISMCQAGMLSPEGQCKTFDDTANGFVPGEGVGAIVLKRLEDAKRDNDFIYGVILGSGINQDGKTNGITAPSANSQIELEREVYQKYNIHPETISYIETHGTGTKLGDPIELEALATVFSEKTEKKGFCALASVKSNIGHTSAAAGVASLQKVLLSMKHQELVPSLNFNKANSYFNFENSAFYVNTKRKKWENLLETPRRAAISSFGFSGTNAHLVVQEYSCDQTNTIQEVVQPVIIPLSARTKEQLQLSVNNLLSFLEKDIYNNEIATKDYEIKDAIVQMVSELLKMKPELLDINQEFSEYGLDTVLQISLLELLEKQYSTQLNSHEFMKKNSITILSEWFDILTTKEKNDQVVDIVDVSYTLQIGREAMEYRLAFMVNSMAELKEKLQLFASGKQYIENCYQGEAKKNKDTLSVFAVDEDLQKTIDIWIQRKKLTKLAEFWAKGLEFDWNKLYGNQKPKRTSLPTYPFIKERYWILQTQKTRVLGARIDTHVIHPLVHENTSNLSQQRFTSRFSGQEFFLQDHKIKGEKPKRISLPTYPFLKERYWIPETQLKSVELADKAGEHKYRPRLNPRDSEFALPTIGKPKIRLQDLTGENQTKIETVKRKSFHLEDRFSTPGTVAKISQQMQSQAEIVAEKKGSISLEQLEDTLTASLARVLCLKERKIDQQKPFQEIGLDSIIGVEWIKEINEQYQLKIEATKIYDYPTIKTLAGFVHKKMEKNIDFLLSQTIPSKSDSLPLLLATESVYSGSRINSNHELTNIIYFQPQYENKNLYFYSDDYDENWEQEGKVSIRYMINPENNICLRDHLVFDTYLFPTDAYLELVYTACKTYFSIANIDFVSVIIVKPLLGVCEKNNYLRVVFQSYEDGVQFTVLSSFSPNDKNEIVHIRGVIKERKGGEEKTSKYINNRNFIVQKKYQKEELKVLQENIQVGSFYSGLQMLLFGEKCALGHIEIPSQKDNFLLDPSIVSAGLATAMSYGGYNVSTQHELDMDVFLPYKLENISISTIFTETSYLCYVEIKEIEKDAVSLYFEIIDSTDKVIFSVESIKLQRARRESIHEQIHALKNTALTKVSPSALEYTKDVAIIGMSCRFPMSKNVDSFWNNLKEGKDCITKVPADRWQEYQNWYHPETHHRHTSYSKWGGFIEDIDTFDAAFFGISPIEAEAMDPQQRIFLQECWSAIEYAGYDPTTFENQKCGVYVGCTAGDYSKVLAKEGQDTLGLSFMGTSSAILAARISYFLNLKGAAIAVDTACSSSLTAAHLACESIRKGENEVALAGGIQLFLTPVGHILTSQVGMQSKDGRCFTFDASANGAVFSEGCGVVFFKSLAKAKLDRDHILGVIKGSHINQDGKTNGITAPSSTSQTELIIDTYKQYNIDPTKISYVEAHGTGTPLGDPIEVNALATAFQKFSGEKNYCSLGSVKTNIGHGGFAAGIAGLIKVLLCLKHKKLVPSLHYKEPNPHISFTESPFYVNTKYQDWQCKENGTRLAAISSFGFSGTNVHLVLEEAFGIPKKSDILRDVYFVPEVQIASDILGYDLQELCLSDPQKQLNLTQFTQPALYVVNTLRWLDEKKSLGKIDYLMGHSLGEYNALLAAGAFEYETGLKLVRERGRLMGEASGGGMLAVIDIPAKELQDYLKKHNLVELDIANYNTEKQLVLSGPNEIIQKAHAMMSKDKIRAMPLRVSAAFHSRYMEKAADEFSLFLQNFSFNSLKMPVIANATARPYDDKQIAETLARQIASSVLWSESVRYLMAKEAKFEFVELAENPVVSKMIKAIQKEESPLQLSEEEVMEVKVSDVKEAKNAEKVESHLVHQESSKATLEEKSTPKAKSQQVSVAEKEKSQQVSVAEKEKSEGNISEISINNKNSTLVSDTEKKNAHVVIENKVENSKLNSLSISADKLGAKSFQQRYGIKYSYLTGAMYRGIASKEVVVAMGKCGLMGFLGTGGMSLKEIEENILYIQKELSVSEAYGANLLCHLDKPQIELDTVELYFKLGVTCVEAAAFMMMTPALVYFRTKGLEKNAQGKINCKNRIIAKISRPEVAEKFLSPAPKRIVDKLLAEGKITQEQAEMSQQVAMSFDITVEADSGGHTDQGIPTVLLPSMQSLKKEIEKRYDYSEKIHIGLAGGIGTPQAAASAFIMGADYILTGSINQCTVEAGTSDLVKTMLQDINVQDTDYAPAGDMFEIGARVQVLKRGVFFPARANKLHTLYHQYNSLEELPAQVKSQIEDKYFGKSFDDIWQETRQYFRNQGDHDVITKAEKNPKQKMALVFRWYFGYSSRIAFAGDEKKKVDFQVHTGPALGSFNQWVKGTALESWKNRHVDKIAEKLMSETAILFEEKMKFFYNASENNDAGNTIEKTSPLVLTEHPAGQKEIFTIIVGHCKDVLGNVDDYPFDYSSSLKKLGANSIDRAEIVALTLETLNLDFPRTELFGAKNMGELAELIYAKRS